MRIRPIPPAAYAATTAVTYLTVAVGVLADLCRHPLTFPAGVTLAAGVYALMCLTRGDIRGEAISAAVMLYALCVDFALAPPPDHVWVLWVYAGFVGLVIIIGLRVGWLCRRL